MSYAWFAGNFCPQSAVCSLNEPLKPKEGPDIREMDYENHTLPPFLAEIRKFEIPPVGEVQWMKAEGQLLDLEQYITLYPIIGYLYGSPASREVFPLPNLNDYPENEYYICVKGGRTPERP